VIHARRCATAERINGRDRNRLCRHGEGDSSWEDGTIPNRELRPVVGCWVTGGRRKLSASSVKILPLQFFLQAAQSATVPIPTSDGRTREFALRNKGI